MAKLLKKNHTTNYHFNCGVSLENFALYVNFGKIINTYFNNAIDIHHIFPRKWCETNKLSRDIWNSVVNKAPLAAGTNRFIGGDSAADAQQGGYVTNEGASTHQLWACEASLSCSAAGGAQHAQAGDQCKHTKTQFERMGRGPVGQHHRRDIAHADSARQPW